MNADPCTLSATELVELYRTHAASPVEVAQAVLKRIEKLNPAFNAFCFISEDILQEAKTAEAR